MNIKALKRWLNRTQIDCRIHSLESILPIESFWTTVTGAKVMMPKEAAAHWTARSWEVRFPVSLEFVSGLAGNLTRLDCRVPTESCIVGPHKLCSMLWTEIVSDSSSLNYIHFRTRNRFFIHSFANSIWAISRCLLKSLFWINLFAQCWQTILSPSCTVFLWAPTFSFLLDL